MLPLAIVLVLFVLLVLDLSIIKVSFFAPALCHFMTSAGVFYLSFILLYIIIPINIISAMISNLANISPIMILSVYLFNDLCLLCHSVAVFICSPSGLLC